MCRNVAGVAFMVAFLFLFMVALEKLWERMENFYQSHFSKRSEQVCISLYLSYLKGQSHVMKKSEIKTL